MISKPVNNYRQLFITSALFLTLLTVISFSYTSSMEKYVNETDSQTIKESSLILQDINSMTTEELQKEVERLSIKGELPFDTGLLLIERWTVK